MLRRRLDWVLGAVVILACGVGFLLFLQGPHPFDPATYFDAAMDFPGGGLNLFTLRIGLTIPVWIAVEALAPSEASFYAIPLLSTLLLGGAVYGTMVVLFRARMLAAGAALVAVLNAAYLLNASSIFPDTTATATFTAGFFCLVLGAGERLTGRWPLVAAAGAGALFGWTYLIREFSPILAPAVIAALVFLRYPPRRMLVVGAAAGVTAATELAYAAARSVNPFVHASRLLDGSGSGVGDARVEHIQSQLDNVFDSLAVFPRLLLAWDSGWLLLLLLVPLAAGLALTRDRRLWLFAAWLVSYWLIMAGAGLVSRPSGGWLLNITNIRYWYPALPALVMGGFGGLALLAERFSPRVRGFALAPVAAAAVGLVVLVPGVVEFRSCEGDPAWRTEPRERWTELRSWFGTPAADRYAELWTDWRTHRVVPAYTSSAIGGDLWDGRISHVLRLAGDPVPSAAREDSIILVHRGFLRADLGALRDDWRPVFVTDDGALVVLAGGEGGHSAVWWTPLEPAADRAEPGSCGVSPYEPR